ncbi:translation initiation factor IF-2-like isoform X2 [Ailuropoda melanoleuca]|nr:translation initiation factor IF-2-like isoform X2 [Ailuropoda melanoleuca]XP_034518848.1 translation initiation factor IF-2-like isoform X2 [Ailuropoda melanoleuca]
MVKCLAWTQEREPVTQRAGRGGPGEETEEDRRPFWAWEAERPGQRPLGSHALLANSTGPAGAVSPSAVWPSPPIPGGRGGAEPLSGGAAAASHSSSGPHGAVTSVLSVTAVTSVLHLQRGRRQLLLSASPAPGPPRSAGVVPRPLRSGSFRFLAATVGQRFCLWIRTGTARRRSRGRCGPQGEAGVWPRAEPPGLAPAGRPAGGAPCGHAELHLPGTGWVEGRPQAPAGCAVPGGGSSQALCKGAAQRPDSALGSRFRGLGDGGRSRGRGPGPRLA